MLRLKLLSVILTLVFAAGCTAVSPNAGTQAVLVEKPWLFGHGGVDSEPVNTGLSFVAPTTDAIYINMQPEQYEVKFDDLMSSDGVPLDFDAIIRLRVTDAVDLVKKFGPHWYENNVEREFSNRVRQAVRKHGMNETAIQTVAIDAIDKEVSEQMAGYIERTKMPIALLDVTVGKANPPDSIKNQRIETATQEQRIMTEAQKKLAEDARRNAELSRATADNAYRNAMSLSPDQFLKLETIKMQRQVCDATGSHCTFLITSTSVPVILDAK